MAGKPLPIGAEDLAALAEKYETLGALRRARERGEPPPTKTAIRELAGRFPGALFELDTLPLEEIDERATALRTARARLVPTETEANAEADAETPAWMTWMARYHALVRGDLASRRDEPRQATRRPRATATAIATIARETMASPAEVEAALFARKRRGVSR